MRIDPFLSPLFPGIGRGGLDKDSQALCISQAIDLTVLI